MQLSIYVASSWRNEHQQSVVQALRSFGHTVYDFRTATGSNSWKEWNGGWKSWTSEQYREALEQPQALIGYDSNMYALAQAMLCVLVLPAGASAAYEYGFHNALLGKKGIVYMPEKGEPDLMYRGSRFAFALDELVQEVAAYAASA